MLSNPPKLVRGGTKLLRIGVSDCSLMLQRRRKAGPLRNRNANHVASPAGGAKLVIPFADGGHRIRRDGDIHGRGRRAK